MKLTEDLLAFFKENGYLILPKVLDLELCKEAQDRLWSTLPKESKLKKEDPSTHIGPFEETDIQEDVTNLRIGFKWQVRFVGTDKLIIDLVFSDTLKDIAEQLLGKESLVVPKVGGSTMGSYEQLGQEGQLTLPWVMKELEEFMLLSLMGIHLENLIFVIQMAILLI